MALSTNLTRLLLFGSMLSSVSLYSGCVTPRELNEDDDDSTPTQILDSDGDGINDTDDCAPTDPDRWRNWGQQDGLLNDSDSDGFGGLEYSGEPICGTDDVPPGFSLIPDDCDDGDQNIWRNENIFPDLDLDGYFSLESIEQCIGKSIPEGFSQTPGTDCNDADPFAFLEVSGFIDADGDTFPGTAGLICYDGVTLPTSTSLTQDDCNDVEPLWFPGGVELCDLISDRNCDGSVDCGTLPGRFTFVSNRDGSYDVFIMNADGGYQTNLTNSTTIEESNPRWNPAGTQIVYSAEDTIAGTVDLHIINDNGTGLVALTNDPNIDYLTPAWFPNGTEISAIAVDTSTLNEKIVNINVATGTVTDITSFAPNTYSSLDINPATGLALLVTSNQSGNNDIYSVDPNTGAFTILIDNPANDSNAKFKFDGIEFVYDSNRLDDGGTGTLQLYQTDTNWAPQSWIQSGIGITHNEYDPTYFATYLSDQIIFSSDVTGTAQLYQGEIFTGLPNPPRSQITTLGNNEGPDSTANPGP